MKQTLLFVNSGHCNSDSGVVVGNYIERDIVKKIRDELKILLPDALYVPDELNLRQSIDWVNEKVSPDDIAIDIHINANKDKTLRGTECYYFKNKELAESLSKQVAESLGIPNRGAKPDTQTWLGSLGWVRQLKCNSVVLECGYMTNTLDLNIIINNTDKIARGIYELLTYSNTDKLQKENTQLRQLVNQLMSYIIKMFGRNQ